MMKKINIISSYRIIIYAFTYGLGFYYLKIFSKQNSWLIAIVGSILGFFYIKMISTIKNTYKGKTTYEINKIILGNLIGTIVNITFSLIFILLSIITSWYLFVFLKSYFLEKTPIIIIGVISILPIVYAINKNDMVLIKSNVIFSFIILILNIIAIIFLLPQAEMSNLKPFVEININNMFKGLFGFTCTTFLPTYAINDNLKFKNFYNFFFKIMLSILSIVFCTYLILGNSIVEMVDFPEFFVLRKIGLLANGTRIDSFIIIGWLLSVYSANLTFIFYIRNFLNFEIKKFKKSYTYFILVFIFIIALNIFKNVTIGKLFILNYLPFILFITLFLINLIIFIKIKVKLLIVSHKY